MRSGHHECWLAYFKPRGRGCATIGSSGQVVVMAAARRRSPVRSCLAVFDGARPNESARHPASSG